MALVQLLQQTDMTASGSGFTDFSPNWSTSMFEVFLDTYPMHVTMFGTFDTNADAAGTVNRVHYDTTDGDRADNMIITGLNHYKEDYEDWIYNASVVVDFLEDILAGADRLVGSSAGDVMVGFGGRDTLLGNGGPDTMAGGEGPDLLVGGPGRDILESDAGADRFDYNAVAESRPGAANRDVIQFFTRTPRDKVDLATIDANTRFAGNQHFEFIGTKAFTGNAGDPQHRGELRYKDLGASVIAQGDINGDRIADFEIQIGTDNLFAADFVL